MTCYFGSCMLKGLGNALFRKRSSDAGENTSGSERVNS